MKGPLHTALAQLPALAAGWIPHGLVVLFVFYTRVPPDLVGAAERIAIFLAIFSLLLLELALAAALACLCEAALGRLHRGWVADLVKALALALAVGGLVASSLKFWTTGVHLKESDLWFARTNFRQIVEEAQVAEALVLLGLPLAALALAAGVLVQLRRRRARDAAAGARALALTAAGAAAVLALTFALSPAVRTFTTGFIPETYWLARSTHGFSPPAAAAAAGAAAAGGRGPAIGEYPPRPGTRVAPRAPGVRPANVVLVMLESVPWSRSGLAPGGREGIVPHLERLAAESVVFTRPYAVSTHSDYAQMAILSSLYPRKYDRHDYYGAIEYPRTLLWDALEPAGYATSLFSCQNERWGNMLAFLDTPGLEVLRHSPSWPRAPHKGRGVESKVYEETPVSEWMRWREERGTEPYFTYLNFQSNHFPYEVPAEAPRPFAPFALDFPASFLQYPVEKVPVMLNRFDNALAYADRWLGEIVGFLEARGEWERTALVVVSDHGEAFYEHGQPTHGTSLYEEQVRSLLLLRLPGVEPRVVEEPVSLLDVGPALLAYLGLPPHGNFQGRADILEPGYSAAGRPLFFTIQGLTFEDGLLLDGWKYVVNWDRRERRLFDLAADPGETDDLLAAEPEKAEALDRTLRGLLSRQLAYYAERGWRDGYYPPPLP